MSDIATSDSLASQLNSERSPEITGLNLASIYLQATAQSRSRLGCLASPLFDSVEGEPAEYSPWQRWDSCGQAPSLAAPAASQCQASCLSSTAPQPAARERLCARLRRAPSSLRLQGQPDGTSGPSLSSLVDSHTTEQESHGPYVAPRPTSLSRGPKSCYEKCQNSNADEISRVTGLSDSNLSAHTHLPIDKVRSIARQDVAVRSRSSNVVLQIPNDPADLFD